MTLAIPVWEGRVSPVLDTAKRLLIVRLEDGRVVGRDEAPLREQAPPARASALSQLGIHLLICGALSAQLQAAIAGHGMDLISWTMGPVDEVLHAYLAGELDDPRYAMPGGPAGLPSTSGPA